MRPLRHGCGVWAVLWAIAAVAGCGQPESARPTPLTEPPRSVGVRIEEGSAVPLILLKQVDSGSPVGSTVPFAVAEDVVADGNVLIAKGTLVTARVVASRAAGALSGLERRPARLSIVLDSVTAEDGQKLALAGVNHAPADEPLVLTRDSSESTPASPGLDNLSQTAEGKRMLSGLADRLKTGDGLDDPATRNALGDLVARLSPTERGAAPAARATGSPLEFAARLRRGGIDPKTLASLDPGTLSAAFQAVRIAGQVGATLFHALKGRNIRAYPGWEIEGYLASSATIAVSK